MHNQPSYPRRGVPWRLVLIVAALALLVLLIGQARAALDPLERARQEAALERQEQIDQALSGLDLFVAGAWKIAPLALLAGVAVTILTIAYRRWATHDYIRAAHVTAAIRATRSRGLPERLESLTLHDSSRPLIQSPPEAPAQLAALAGVPTFGQLLDDGKVGRGNPLLLGFDAESGQEIDGSWLDLYSTITAGLPGTGKTTAQRYFACQTALHGAHFAVIDPHAGAADDSLAATLAPLSACFIAEPASTDRAILDVVHHVADIGKRRVSGQDRDQTPIILWCDELTALLGRSTVGAELAGLLEQIAQEYRKRWVYVSASGQIWTAARATSELRDSFASVLCFRMKRGQARLLLPTEEAATVERLQTGRAVLWRTSGATTTIAIPNTTAADVARVGNSLDAEGGTRPAAGRPFGFRPGSARGSPRRAVEPGSEPGPEPLSEPPGSPRPTALSPRAARVRQLLAEKRSFNEIIRLVWRVEGKGPAYQRAAEELREVLAAIAALAG